VNTNRESLVLAALAVGLLGLALVWSAADAGAQEPPSIAITAPAEGEVLPGPDVTVEVTVSGFDLRPPLQETREANAGHIEYLLDVAPTFDQPMPLGEDNVIPSGRFSETFASVLPGEHTVYVCLAYDDYTCIDPSLTDSARVTVGQPSPTVEATPTPEATPSPTPEPPPPTPEPPSPTPPPATPAPTEEPMLDGLSEETPSPCATATPSPTPLRPPLGPVLISTPVAGLAPSTFEDSGNARSLDWTLALAGASVVAIVAMGWLILLGVRQPNGKR
jgi:hypothetical protein